MCPTVRLQCTVQQYHRYIHATLLLFSVFIISLMYIYCAILEQSPPAVHNFVSRADNYRKNFSALDMEIPPNYAKIPPLEKPFQSMPNIQPLQDHINAVNLVNSSLPQAAYHPHPHQPNQQPLQVQPHLGQSSSQWSSSFQAKPRESDSLGAAQDLSPHRVNLRSPSHTCAAVEEKYQDLPPTLPPRRDQSLHGQYGYVSPPGHHRDHLQQQGSNTYPRTQAQSFPGSAPARYLTKDNENWGIWGALYQEQQLLEEAERNQGAPNLHSFATIKVSVTFSSSCPFHS